MFNDELLRNFVIKKMVYHSTISSNIKFSALPHSTWDFGLNYSQINSPDNYQFVVQNDISNYLSKGDFIVSEVHVGLRFAYKEKLMANHSNTIKLGTNTQY